MEMGDSQTTKQMWNLMLEVTGQGPAELFNKNKFQKEKKTGVMTSAVPSLKREIWRPGEKGEREKFWRKLTSSQFSFSGWDRSVTRTKEQKIKMAVKRNSGPLLGTRLKQATWDWCFQPLSKSKTIPHPQWGPRMSFFPAAIWEKRICWLWDRWHRHKPESPERTSRGV